MTLHVLRIVLQSFFFCPLFPEKRLEKFYLESKCKSQLLFRPDELLSPFSCQDLSSSASFVPASCFVCQHKTENSWTWKEFCSYLAEHIEKLALLERKELVFPLQLGYCPPEE